MFRMRVGMKSTCYVVLLFCTAISSLAQTATLRGQVTDESGGVIPRANVTLTGTGGQVTTTAADDIGAYSFSGVAVGNYTVQASAPELVQARPSRVTLKPGPQVLNLTLKVASRSDKVTVQEIGRASCTERAYIS